MTVARSHPFVAILVIALFLYWVVQDPVGAAAMISEVIDWLLGALQLLANRIMQFLTALI